MLGIKIYKPKLCECNTCGLEVKPGNRFISGHNNRGFHPSAAANKKNSDSKIIAQNRPDVKERHRITNAKPEVKERRSEAQKLAQNKPGVKERKIESTRITNLRPEIKERRCKAQKLAQNRPEVRKRKSAAAKIVSERLEIKKKKIERMIKKWQDPVWAKMMCIAIGRLPNKPEMRLNEILQSLYPGEWKYVGDGQFFISGKCPDFVNCNGQKKIIELFGDYWHRDEDPQDRIDIFTPFGYETLVIWEKELKNFTKVRRKIFDFAEEG